MPRKWSDVAASAAFQALSFDEQEEARRQYFEDIIAPQVPEEDVGFALEQFLTDVRGGGAGRGSMTPPLASELQPGYSIYQEPRQPFSLADEYGEVANSLEMPQQADQRGIIQRVGEFLRPSPQRSVLDQPFSTEEQARVRQAEIDRRLAYGAGPIRPEVVRAADEVRSARGTGTTIEFKDQGYGDRVNKVVQEMDRRGERSTADVFESVNRKPIRDAVTEAKADEWRSTGEWAADTLSAVAQGVVTLPQLAANIIAPDSSVAESLRKTQKELQAQESDVLKAQREMLRQRVESEDGFLGKYWSTVKELVTNPALTLSEGIKQVPMFLGVVGGAKLGAAAASGTVNVAGRAVPTVALADAIGGGTVTAAARAAGSKIGGAGTAMVMTGGDAAGSAYEELVDPRRTPLSEWKKNSDYQTLVQEKVQAGASEAEASKAAIQELAVAKARVAALITMPLGLLGFMGAEAAVASRGLRAVGREALTGKGALKLIGKENITEQLEEGGTQLGANLLAGTVNTQKDPLQDVAQAMATAGVTSTPFGVIGAYSQYRAAQEQAAQPVAPGVDTTARAVLDPQSYQPELLAPQAATRQATDIGPSAPPQIANFTPADSPTKRAGMVDIAIPLPGAAAEPALGGLNVGATGTPGGLAGAGGAPGGGVPGGGLDAAGSRLEPTAGIGDRLAGMPGANDQQAVPARGSNVQRSPGLNRPFDRATDAELLTRTEAAIGGEPLTWTGRSKTGYANEQDAEQAMATASTVIDTRQTHTWRVEPMGNGRFQIVGYPKETNLGTEATQAQQGQTQGQVIPRPATAGTGLGASLAPGGGAPQRFGADFGVGQLATGPITQSRQPGALATSAGAEAAGITKPLKLAPPAPLRVTGQVLTQLKAATNIDAEVDTTPLTEAQQATSAVARLLGKTVTFLKSEKPGELPNGFVISGVSNKDIYLANDSDDAPLSVAMHEIYHTLPEPQRKALNTQLLALFKQDQRGEFAAQFKYDAKNDALLDEEIPAFMVQAISKREDFWQELRTKMGNKEFAEVAKVILAKLGDILTGAKKEYGEEFVNKYITDIAKARDLLTTAYADSMRDQGLRPDAVLLRDPDAVPMFSGRSRIGMDFKDVIKRTPELQAAAERVKAGEMTAAEYDKLVNEFKPVEPYTSVPPPATESAIKSALTSDKLERIGVPSKTLKAGDPVGLRLDIPAYSNHGTWVVSVHEQESGYSAGKSIGYEPVAAATNVTFGVVEKAAMNIAGGKPKATIAVIKGGWKPTTPAEAKLRADQALKSKDWVQVGMDPERHSYFYDRKTMEPVVSAAEVIQIGPLVLAKNPTYGEKSEFMFSNRVVPKATDYKLESDNFAAPKTVDFLPTELVDRAKGYIAQFKAEAAPVQLSGADRVRAEGLLRPRMKLAEEAKLEYDQKILDIAERTGSIGQMLAPLKGIKRAAEKLAIEEKFNVDNIKDLLRSTIVVDSYEDAPAVVDEIRKEFDVLRIKNRTDVQMQGDGVESVGFLPSGYGDVLINVRMPNGTVAEIQVNVPEMLAAKGEEGHKLYEIERVQPKGSATREVVVQAQTDYYREAAAAAERRKKASSEGAAARGMASRSTSSPVDSSSLNTLPSGNLTQSPPEKSATKTQLSGKDSGTFIGSPDESSVSQSLYTGEEARADVMPPEEIESGGIMFSLRRIEEINDAPEITMQDLVGQTVFPILADLTAAGYTYMGKELRGGPYYTLLPSNTKAGLIWANDAKGVSSFKEKKAKRGVIGLIVAMKQTSHATNNTVANIIFRAVEDEVQKGSVKAEDVPKLDEIVRGLAKRTVTKERTIKGEKFKETKPVFPKFADFPGFSDREASERFLRALPFEARGLFFEEMTKPTVEDLGLGVIRKVINETVEPDLRGLNMGDVIMAIRFDPDAATVELGAKTDTPIHDSYRYAVKGEVIGKFKRPISFENVFVDLMKERRAGGQKNVVRDYRSLTLRKPEQVITQDIADLVSGEGYRNIASPAEAQAAVSAANIDWTKIDRPTAAGVREFLRTSRVYGRSEQTPEFDAAKKLIREGKLRIFRLAETENWFSLEDRDGQRVMTSIMVAQPGVRRETLFGDMIEVAKANGATHIEIGETVAPLNKVDAPRRVAPILSELSAMTDNDLANLGIDPAEVRRLSGKIDDGGTQVSPTSVVMMSNRVSPADKIKWREISEVKREIGLDRLPDHIIPFADFMGTMATKASNGGLTARDVIKAYTIARSSMNRGAVTTSKVVDSGLLLPASFTDAKIRPEGAFGYWLLSPVGQRYLNAAEVGIVDEAAVADAVKVMAPFGTQNTLGEDLKRAASGDLHSRLPALTAAIKKAAEGGDAVQDWQAALDDLYGVREAKKGFLGSLLGFGQLPTFDARQINVNVERESKEDTLRALTSTKARDVVATLAKRMDALSLTMDKKYAPFYQHLAHHAVWDAVGGTETTHEDVVESMLMASNRYRPKVSPQSELNKDIEGASINLQRYIREAEQRRQLPKLTIGRMPHVLNMLGARTQEFDISTSIVRKVFLEKHKDDLPNVTAKQLVEGIYRPAMVLKSKDGNPREFELVLPITNDQGALIVPIKVSVDNTDPNGAVMSIYAKGVSISGGKPNEQVLMKRINDGNLLYVDPGLAKQALTGRQSGDARLNDKFVSWSAVWPKLEKMISERKVKTDVNLMGWIGDNYKPGSSPQGWEDAPAFSNRARTEDKEVADLFRDLQNARGLGRVRALEKVDAHPMSATIRQIDEEFMDILERLDDAGLVKINCK
jgi:hypothetical protein